MKFKTFKKVAKETNLPEELRTIIATKLFYEGKKPKEVLEDFKKIGEFDEKKQEEILEYAKALKRHKIFGDVLCYGSIAGVVTLTGAACYYIGRNDKTSEVLAGKMFESGRTYQLNSLEAKALNEGETSVKHTVGKITRWLVCKVTDEQPESWNEEDSDRIGY